jgi:hypothetical protein
MDFESPPKTGFTWVCTVNKPAGDLALAVVTIQRMSVPYSWLPAWRWACSDPVDGILTSTSPRIGIFRDQRACKEGPTSTNGSMGGERGVGAIGGVSADLSDAPGSVTVRLPATVRKDIAATDNRCGHYSMGIAWCVGDSGGSVHLHGTRSPQRDWRDTVATPQTNRPS